MECLKISNFITVLLTSLCLWLKLFNNPGQFPNHTKTTQKGLVSCSLTKSNSSAVFNNMSQFFHVQPLCCQYLHVTLHTSSRKMWNPFTSKQKHLQPLASVQTFWLLCSKSGIITAGMVNLSVDFTAISTVCKVIHWLTFDKGSTFLLQTPWMSNYLWSSFISFTLMMVLIMKQALNLIYPDRFVRW